MRVEIIETDEGEHLCKSCRFVNIVCDFGYKEINRKGKTIVCEGFYMRASLQDLEDERQEALKPDRKKLLEWAGKIEKIEMPAVTDPQMINIGRRASDMLDHAAEYIKTEVKKL